MRGHIWAYLTNYTHGVLKSKVYDGHSFEMGTLGEPFRAT